MGILGDAIIADRLLHQADVLTDVAISAAEDGREADANIFSAEADRRRQEARRIIATFKA